MNYLAHAFLSFSKGQLVGNMIADFVRNSERGDFSSEIQNGIKLHREIDTFTDAHLEIHEAKKVFQPLVRLYSGVFVDVAFDYFLAKELAKKHQKFKQWTGEVYATLWNHENILPPDFIKMLKNMAKEDWLYNYQTEQGIKFSMQNVLDKAKYLDKDIPVFEVFLKRKAVLESHFKKFFPVLETHAETMFPR